MLVSSRDLIIASFGQTVGLCLFLYGHRSTSVLIDVLSFTALPWANPCHSCWPDCPRRHTLGWMSFVKIDGLATETSACSRFEGESVAVKVQPHPAGFPTSAAGLSRSACRRSTCPLPMLQCVPATRSTGSDEGVQGHHQQASTTAPLLFDRIFFRFPLSPHGDAGDCVLLWAWSRVSFSHSQTHCLDAFCLPFCRSNVHTSRRADVTCLVLEVPRTVKSTHSIT